MPAALVALPAVAAAWSGDAAAQIDDPGRASAAYVVECPETLSETECAVDVSTYVGWRVFERHSASCQGRDAEGSTSAPSLIHRLERYARRAFIRALDEGYAGPYAALPPWGENPQVARYYDELWRYLSARMRGDLPAGPLRPLRDSRAP